MNSDFIAILRKLVAEQGKESLINPAKCKALLADYTCGEYKKENRLVLQALEAEVSKAIDAAKDLELCWKQQVRVLREDYSLASNVAADVVSALLLVLRGYTVSPETSFEILGQDQCNTTSGEPGKADVSDSSACIQRGKAYLKQGDYDEAINEFTEAVRFDPGSSLAYAGRGDAYRLQGQNDNAIKDLNKAIKLDQGNSWAYAKRGEIYRKQGKYDSAIKDLNEAIRLEPDYWAYGSRGEAYREQGKYDSAIRDLSEAIRLNPDYSFAYRCRGTAYRQQDQHDRAIKDLTEAIRLKPKEYISYIRRGEAYRKQGEYDSAIEDFNEALKLDKDNSAARNGLNQAIKLKAEKEEEEEEEDEDEEEEEEASKGKWISPGKTHTMSTILIGLLSFVLSIFGFILWLALRKHYPEQAKACLTGSIIGSAIVILGIGLTYIPDMPIILAGAGIIVLFFWWRKPKCPNCGKRSLKKIKTVALGRAESGYDTVTRRDIYRDKHGNRTGSRERKVQVRVKRQPVRTYQRCRSCGRDCYIDSIRKWEG